MRIFVLAPLLLAACAPPSSVVVVDDAASPPWVKAAVGAAAHFWASHGIVVDEQADGGLHAKIVAQSDTGFWGEFNGAQGSGAGELLIAADNEADPAYTVAVVAHEIGHAVGLSHVSDNLDTASLMSPDIYLDKNNLPLWSKYDEQELVAAFGGKAP